MGPDFLKSFMARPLTRKLLVLLGILSVLGILGLFVTTNLARLGDTPYYTSTDGHYGRSVGFLHYLEQGDPRFLQRFGEPIAWERGLDWRRFPLFVAYPPLVYLVTALFYTLRDVSLETARWSMTLWGLLLLLGLFGLGRHLGGWIGGLATLALAVSSPLLVAFTRWYVLDLPLAAFTALSLLALFKSDRGRRLGWTLAWAFAAAGAGLCKWMALLFLAPPALWILLPGLFASRRAMLLSLAYMLPAGLLGGGFFFARSACQSPLLWLSGGRWLMHFALEVGLPSLLALLVTGLAARSLRDPEGRVHADVRPLLHVGLSLTLAALLALPWYWWALGDLLANAGYNVGELRPPQPGETLRTVDRILHESLPSPWLLLGLGLVAAPLAGRKRAPEILLLGLVSAGLLFFFVQTGKPAQLTVAHLDSRLLLPVLVFALPLAGWWAGRAGVLGPVLVAGLLLLGLQNQRRVYAAIPGQRFEAGAETLIEDLQYYGKRERARELLIVPMAWLPALSLDEELYADMLLGAHLLLTVGHCNGANEGDKSLEELPSGYKLSRTEILVILRPPNLSHQALRERVDSLCERPIRESGTLRPYGRLGTSFFIFEEQVSGTPIP